jgi:hypothetical protein
MAGGTDAKTALTAEEIHNRQVRAPRPHWRVLRGVAAA